FELLADALDCDDRRIAGRMNVGGFEQRLRLRPSRRNEARSGCEPGEGAQGDAQGCAQAERAAAIDLTAMHFGYPPGGGLRAPVLATGWDETDRPRAAPEPAFGAGHCFAGALMVAIRSYDDLITMPPSVKRADETPSRPSTARPLLAPRSLTHQLAAQLTA